MVSTPMSVTRAPDSASDPTICPFCGQPLLNTQAVEHLAHQKAAYEVKLRTDLEAEAEARAQARVEKVEKDLKVRTAKQVQAAVRERADEVAGLNRQLQEVQKNQEAKVKVEVCKQVADAEASQRASLEQEFGKRDKQLQATLTKVQEQNAELSRRVERLSAGDRGEFNEEAILAQLSRAFPDDDIKRTRRGQRGADTSSTSGCAPTEISSKQDSLSMSARTRCMEQQLHNANEGTSKAASHAICDPGSRCFPRGSQNLAVIDGIVVVEPARSVALAEVMRRMVIKTYRSGAVTGSRVEKTAELFRFTVQHGVPPEVGFAIRIK